MKSTPTTLVLAIAACGHAAPLGRVDVAKRQVESQMSDGQRCVSSLRGAGCLTNR